MEVTKTIWQHPLPYDIEDNWALSGLSLYKSPYEAVNTENSNDSVHLFFPDKLRQKTYKFLTEFNGLSLYAVKANPHPAVLKTLWQAGVRSFDVASIREVQEILELFPTAQLYFMHPVKSRFAIRRAYELGVRKFAFDHADELTKIYEETQNADDLQLFLRIDVNRKGAAYALEGKFGADIEQSISLLNTARSKTETLGVCFHVGSQCMRPEAFAEAIHDVRQLVDLAGIDIDVLDIGGGFPVDYPDLKPQDLSIYFDKIHNAIDECDFNHIPMICEPGRALVAESGSIATRIELRKDNDLYINDGTYGSLFDVGVPEWQFPLALLKKDDQASHNETVNFHFFGPTCDSCDKMAGPYTLPSNAQEGDWIIFSHIGAYGYAMQSKFNGFYSETFVAIIEENDNLIPLNVHTPTIQSKFRNTLKSYGQKNGN
jgi:ornithine decarboxylase